MSEVGVIVNSRNVIGTLGSAVALAVSFGLLALVAAGFLGGDIR